MNINRSSFPMFARPAVIAGAVLVHLAAGTAAPASAQTAGSTIVRVPPVVVEAPVTVIQRSDIERMHAVAATIEAIRPVIEVTVATDAIRAEAMALQAVTAFGQGQGQGRGTGVGGARPVSVYSYRESGSYDAGLSYLSNDQWERAIDQFDRVIKAGKTRVDGAMYWKAYALDRLGQRNEALATLQELQKSYPNSRWLGDAKALEIEVRQHAGQAVRPEDHANEDLKLLAINSLMQSDPERAVPMLQQVLKQQNPLKVKERALFVLAQSSSPQARDVVAQVARGGGNPDLQMKAVRYLGIYGRSNTQVLADIYGSSNDPDVKREIIRGMMLAKDVDRLLNIAKTESSPELRSEAIRQLGAMRADGELFQLYKGELAGEIREQILRSMVVSGNAERVAEIARAETDAKLRASAVRNLGTMDEKKTGDALVQIYKSDKDSGVKKAVINALFIQRNAKALVDLARAESDLTLKKEIVSRLSTMKSKEATDYMLELLK